MVFYILIGIVFIAEIIIGVTIITNLLKLRKVFVESDNFLTEIRPQIISIVKTGRGISEQFVELSPFVVNSIKNIVYKFIMNNIKNTLIGLIVWGIKRKLKFKH